MKRSIGLFLVGLGAGLIHVGLTLMLLGAWLALDLDRWFDELLQESKAPGLQEPDGGRRGD